ncbi:MAG TPA: M20/M25/M40 family metallo-hydrolase [Verrucomicrobiae bacterium]|nr:M20/M25/M40 family metallo-hydrolase [Verrucomicrobiae bacterium]
MHDAVKLLRDLIALPSVNPAFLPERDPRGGEQRIVDFLTATATRAGLDVETDEVFPNRCNLIIRLLPAGRIRQRVVLAPHMDTVGVSSDEQFQPVLKRGRLHGRGACDTKGSVAAMTAALLNLAAAARRPSGTEVMLIALVDEESAQSGSRHLVRRGFRAELAVVGEPTRLRVVTAHKGDLWLQLETRGVAAHGSRPELGRNAVHLMARIVDLLETRYARQLRRLRHPLLRHATINVGTIAGGRQPNIVPDRCVIRIDRRTVPGERDSAVKQEILRFIRQHGFTASLVDTKSEGPAPPLETDRRLPLVQQFLRCAGQKDPAGVDFFTDAGVLAAGGIPSVVFGPGDIAQAHTADEWVAVRQVERATRLLQRFLEALP